MRIESDPVLKELLVKAIDQVLKERVDILGMTGRIQSETNVLKTDDNIYRSLSRKLKNSSVPLRWHSRCLEIVLKFGVCEIKEYIIHNSLLEAVYKEQNIRYGLKPVLEMASNRADSMSIDEQKEMLQELEEVSKANAELKTELEKIKKKWDALKVDLIYILKDCLRWFLSVNAERKLKKGNQVIISGLN